MKTAPRVLLVFVRFPEPGKVKTRLARHIGPENAARVYEKLLRRTLGVAADFKRRNPDARVVLLHTPEDPPDLVVAKFSGPWEIRCQEGEHLGARMENALRTAFSEGAGSAVLIGSDIADIEAEDLEEGFRLAGEKTVVLGPARDGGFFLIGLGEPCFAGLRFEQWGTGDVYSRTVREITGAGFRLRTVKIRNDVDRPEDAAVLDREYLFRSKLSIIIPTLSAPERLKSLLTRLEDRIWPGDEIILVQAGAPVTVRHLSASTLHAGAPKGRGIQQNAGAALASGDILFFLHDDTYPPSEFPYLIRRTCQREDVAIGCFRLAFSPSDRKLDSIAAWANLRTAVFRLPYGDQGLFCRRAVFEKAGGFWQEYLMEDVGLVRECRKSGRLAVLSSPVYTSPERYLRKGILRASIQNHTIMLLSMLGVDEKELCSLYYGSKRE